MTNASKSAADPKDGQRIAKLLARAGIASRREIERMIADGRVALNETIIDTPATILASLDGVTVDGVPVDAPTAARLFLYHKPSGLLVTERDPGGRPTIYDKLPKDLPRLVPVGRLDLNTEGLLLLTTDGELKRQLELPSTGVERAYRARAYGNVTQAQLEELIHGVEIEGVRYGSINANLERRTGANVWIEMILTEGKNREVRRVLEFLGLKVSRLIRTRYGPFLLADLPVGGVGEVKGHDVAAFRKNPTKNPPPERLRRDEKFSQRPKPEPVKVGTARPRPDGPPPRPRRTQPPPQPGSGRQARDAHHPRSRLRRRPRDLRRQPQSRKTRQWPPRPPRSEGDRLATFARPGPARRGTHRDNPRCPPETLLRRKAAPRCKRRRPPSARVQSRTRPQRPRQARAPAARGRHRRTQRNPPLDPPHPTWRRQAYGCQAPPTNRK
ncbi:pseudouridine synthase [Sphingomonas aliaeris]|uniref:pseudouridine synthase n=1 Tax=Sphingomonas aliaeris TaxID=2759526 RepID=UPI001CECE5C1|nr:pseudouridine synthase [Sphingomonas aliaeris]